MCRRQQEQSEMFEKHKNLNWEESFLFAREGGEDRRDIEKKIEGYRKKMIKRYYILIKNDDDFWIDNNEMNSL